MENSFTLAWSYPWGKHTSQRLSACSGFSTIVLSYHTPAQESFKWAWSGGSGSFDSTSSPELSLSLFPSTMPKPFQMPAQNSAL